MKERGTIARTLDRLAARIPLKRAKPFVYCEGGRIQAGYTSLHRTRSGCLYNGLLRIYRRSR